jgi:hypothetical protein
MLDLFISSICLTEIKIALTRTDNPELTLTQSVISAYIGGGLWIYGIFEKISHLE